MATSTNAHEPSTELTLKARQKILENVVKALENKFYKPELLGNDWQETIVKQRPFIEGASTQSAFELEVTKLLQTLKSSHLGFFHQSARRASSKAALSSTYLADETEHGQRWIFQDVHGGGAAAIARVKSGDILLRVDGKEIAPPEHPVFPMGKTSELEIVGADGIRRIVTVDVAKPTGKKLQFVQPTLVHTEVLSDGIGYLKVAMFPGMIGVEVANEISQAVDGLGKISGLIIDLRGNTGGGVGSLRVMSLLTPGKIPVGFAPSKKWADRDLDREKGSFIRFDSIPASKNSLWLLALCYLPSLITKSPVVLQTEGLGQRGVPWASRHPGQSPYCERSRDDYHFCKGKQASYHCWRKDGGPTVVCNLSESRAWLSLSSANWCVLHVGGYGSRGQSAGARCHCCLRLERTKNRH